MTDKVTDKVLIDSFKEALETQELVFPRHLFCPKGSEPVDWRSAIIVPALTTTPLSVFKYTAKSSEFFTFLGYSLYNDSSLAEDIEFFPTINGQRILRYHGDPDNNFKLNFSMGQDLSNINIVNCNFRLNPNEEIEWKVVNRSNSTSRMGVRLTGFLENSYRETVKYG